MLGKNNNYMYQQKKGQKFAKYSIKKLKVGAASVLVGVGFFFGYHVEASEVTEPKTVVTTEQNILVDKESSKSTTVENNTKTEVVSTPITEVVETPKSREATVEQKVQTTELQEKVSALQTEVNRIRSNEKQKSQIEKAEKLIEEAKELQASKTATQQEVNAKAKEISSLTSILKSIKAEETVKENKNQDSRNGKKMQEGVGFRADTATGTGVGADVVDATAKPYNPNADRSDYSNKEASAGMLNQVSWIDFSNLADWQNVKMLPNGDMALQEGSVYTKEIMKDYIIKITVKSLKPFQATEIYKNRMEAAGATDEEKATYDPTARNWYMKDRGSGAGDANEEVNIIAKPMDGWTEIKKAGVDTGNRKTTIKAEKVATSIGVQFEISGIYRGKVVRPAVVMTDGESANPGESVIFTTNGTGWQLISEVKQNRQDARHYTPVDIGSIQRNTFNERYGNGIDYNNYEEIENHGMRQGKGYGPDNKKIAYKYLSSPDLETGGLGSGVFGPVTNAGSNSTPVVMTKDATEVGFYIVTDGHQAAMIGFVPVDSGDAPATYGEATHTLTTISSFDGSEVKQPYLGSVRPDMDTGNEKNWLGDDTKEEADEGIDQILPDNLKGQTNQVIKMNRERQGSYTLQVQAHTGGAPEAHIYGWIDFNHNGTFEENERSDLATITKDGPVTLQFNNNIAVDDPSVVELGTRVRIATTSKAIEQPTGIAGTGEVEDFKTQITHPPVGEKKTTEGLVKETQRESIHFTARGKTSYDFNTDTSIDTNTPPVYIDNKTGQEITLSADGTYTVAGQGTYKFIIADNKIDVNVEFTPADGFVGEAHGITLRRQDTNGATTDWISKDTAETPVVNDVRQSMDGLYIPKVTVPTSVNATPVNADSQNLQGLPQKGKPTFNVESAKEPVTASAKYPAKLVDPRTNTVTELTTVDAFEQGTTNKIGTYTIVPETGEITFTPNKDFKGIPAPATISADVELTHDKDGNVTTKTLQATYSPTIIPVTPTAAPSDTVDIQGAEQSKEVTFTAGKATVNGEEVEVPMNNNEYKLLGEDGQPAESVPAKNPAGEVIGTYTLKVVDGKPTAVFTPTNKLYSGDVKPVTIQGKDTNGTAVTTTYTPRITPVVPTGTPVATEGVQGATQEGTPTFTQGNDKVPMKIDADQPAKLVDPETGNPTNETTIPAKDETGKQVGTYTIEPTTGKVTFTPNKDFAGTPVPATVEAKDANGTPATAKYTPTVKGVTPTVTPSETVDIQGAEQSKEVTFTAGKATVNGEEVEVPMNNNEYKLLGEDGQPAESVPAKNPAGEVIGTYTLKVVDGKPTAVFTPTNKLYSGDVKPVTIQGKDTNGTAVTTTYTPRITPVVPTGTPVATEGIQGATQEGTPTFTQGNPNVPIDEEVAPTLEGANPEGKVVVPGEGTYTVDKDGKVTFTPEPQFTGTAKGVTVKRVDKNGTPVTATYTPTVTPVIPEGTPAETTGIQGATQEGTPAFKPGNPNVPIDEEVAPTLEGANPEGKVVVPGEGTYTVDKDGKVTFTPEPQFTGTAKGVTVKRVDKNGTPVTATYTPTVTPVTPEGTPAETTGIQGATQEGTPTFKPGNPNVPIDEEVAPTLEGANPEGKVVVPGEGTYTVDKDGKVTFTPEPQFTGTAKGVTVKRVDKNGIPVTAKYTPTVTPVTPTGENAETEGPKAKPQTSTIVFDKKDQDNTTVNFDKGHENVALDPTTTTLVGKDGKPTTEVKVPGEGTYTLANNVITFTPEPDFVGKATGVTVQVKDANGTKVEKTYTPTIRPVTTFVDEAGNPITVDKNNTPVVPEEDGTLPKKDIHGYVFKETKKDEKGNTIHVYQKVSTPRGENESTGNNTPKENKPSEKGIIRDKDGNPIPGFDYERMSPILDIPEYVYVETVTDPDGTVRHIYRPIETVHKDKDGNPIPNVVSKEKGTKESKTIPGYRLVGTKKLPNGDVEHVYEKVQATTTWVDELGNVIQSTEEGLLNPRDIPGYEFVRTETDANGNVRHVYRRITTSQATVKPSTTVEQRKNELPNTGTGEEFVIFGAAAASILAGLGIAIPGKKKDEE